MNPGDVIVIPPGVGHKRVESSEDFGVVGAYPEGANGTCCAACPASARRADRNIAALPLPQNDPVYGPDGPLRKIWEAKPGN